MKRLLKIGRAGTNVKDEYRQMQNRHDAVIELLLKTREVDVDLEDSEYKRTPLSWAIRNKHETVVNLLLVNGARVEE